MSESPKTPHNSESTSSPTPTLTERGEDTIIISTNTALDGYRLKNFYMTNAFQGFVWMVFHFSVVFFFTFQLKSIALVGIFL